jgi:hypothetical protein
VRKFLSGGQWSAAGTSAATASLMDCRRHRMPTAFGFAATGSETEGEKADVFLGTAMLFKDIQVNIRRRKQIEGTQRFAF